MLEEHLLSLLVSMLCFGAAGFIMYIAYDIYRSFYNHNLDMVILLVILVAMNVILGIVNLNMFLSK